MLYHEHIGKEFTKSEIFIKFPGCWVVCEQAKSNIFRNLILFVGKSQEEAQAWVRENGRGFICRGKMTRSGTQVVENSSIKTEDMSGEWHGTFDSRVDGDILLLLPSGKAKVVYPTIYAESWGRYYCDYEWYVEHDVLTLESKTCLRSSRHPIIYTKHRDTCHHYISLELKGDDPSYWLSGGFNLFPTIFYKHDTYIPDDLLQNQYDYYTKNYHLTCTDLEIDCYCEHQRTERIERCGLIQYGKCWDWCSLCIRSWLLES
jgi:hypothetical protein